MQLRPKQQHERKNDQGDREQQDETQSPAAGEPHPLPQNCRNAEQRSQQEAGRRPPQGRNVLGQRLGSDPARSPNDAQCCKDQPALKGDGFWRHALYQGPTFEAAEKLTFVKGTACLAAASFRPYVPLRNEYGFSRLGTIPDAL